MAVKIRLARCGRKKVPIYRVVAADRQKPRDGRFLEVLGLYEPRKKTAERSTLKMERIKFWLARGAVPTATVAKLLQRTS